MKQLKAKCKICGEEFIYAARSALDVGNPPPICHKRACKTNWKYKKDHSYKINKDGVLVGK